MTTWHDCTGFQRDILQAIATITNGDDLPYGLAIKEYLDERYTDPINHSRLYQNLDQLADRNLIEQSAVDDRTNAYTLTDAGQQALQTHAVDLATVSGALSPTEASPVTDGGEL